jgi:hypothetical protein
LSCWWDSYHRCAILQQLTRKLTTFNHTKGDSQLAGNRRTPTTDRDMSIWRKEQPKRIKITIETRQLTVIHTIRELFCERCGQTPTPIEITEHPHKPILITRASPPARVAKKIEDENEN